MRTKPPSRSIHLTIVLLALLPLTAASADSPPLRDVIDAEVGKLWQRENVEPAPPADDAAFLRRVHLDLVGVIPTHDETVAFLADESPDKRAKLIDKLLDDPRFARHQADVWDMVLFGRNPPGYKTRDRPGFENWLREQFEKNVSYRDIVHELLAAEGNSVQDGAPLYLVQYKNHPEDAAVAITQTFLGVQLQCARCHDHPFESWKQRDFFGMAAFLARLEVVTLDKIDKQDAFAIGEKSTGEIMFTGPAAEQEPGQKGEPVAPRFLDGKDVEEPALPDDFEEVKFKSKQMPPAPRFSRKDKLADWIASKDNPWFARAAANRVWAQFMGRGVVHPVIDMSEGNKPSHPELLEALTNAFVQHDFDLKWYIRELVNSRTYQLASTGPVQDAKPRWFERAKVRPLSAEELLESWYIATGYTDMLKATGQEDKIQGRFYGITWGYMLRFFGTPNTGAGDFQGGLHEHLYLNNGQVTSLIDHREGSLVHALLNSDKPWPQRIDRLYLSVLNRYPTDAERDRFVQYVTAEERNDRLVEEAVWTLMTCAEFRFNH